MVVYSCGKILVNREVQDSHHPRSRRGEPCDQLLLAPDLAGAKPVRNQPLALRLGHRPVLSA